VYLYRAIDQHGQVIDVLASPKRDLAATRQFFARALNAARRPTEVTTDRAPAYPRVLDELVPGAWHVVEQYANNPGEDTLQRCRRVLGPDHVATLMTACVLVVALLLGARRSRPVL
jgi:transposase-like protein